MKSNSCDKCGDSYYRRNSIELWLLRNPGRRAGWKKDVARLCLKCLPVSSGHKILDIVGVEFTRPVGRSKRQRTVAVN